MKKSMAVLLGVLSWVLVAKAQASSEGLRERSHAIEMKISGDFKKIQALAHNGESQGSDNLVDIGYRYNWGRWELGFNSVSRMQGSGSDRISLGTLSLVGHFNMITNTPGRDIIPYLAFAAGTTRWDIGSEEIGGNVFSYGIGMKWFPFSELVALDVSAQKLHARIRHVGSGEKGDVSGSQISVGWVLYF